MTAQMSDRFVFHGEDFNLSGINGVGIFNPREYKMEPTTRCCVSGDPKLY